MGNPTHKGISDGEMGRIVGVASQKQNDQSLRSASLLQHLHELAARMGSVQFPFQDNDICAVANIAREVQQLDEDCIKVHVMLETETINSSILRHQLQFFPDSIHSEIATAIESARQSNADELKALQEKLLTLNGSISFLDEKQNTLMKQNTILHPERDMVRTQHEEVISQLNQRMADKASKQITLNETRDDLRDTNQKIVDLETGIMILKEDMIQERSDARREKKHLKQCVHDTTKKTKRQKEANMAKKKELDTLKEEVIISENDLSDIRKVIRRHDANKLRFGNQELTFQAQLDREIRENTDLKEKGFELGQHLLQMEKQHILKRSQLEQSLIEFDLEITQTNSEYDRLEEHWNKLKGEFEDAAQNQDIESSKVMDLDSVLQMKKEDLSRKANETARMKQENDEMELRMKQLDENHQVTVQLLGKQIGDFRDILTRERKERFDLQEKRDSLTRKIDDFKLAFANFMSEMNLRINQAKQEQGELSNEGSRLQKDLRSDCVTTEQLLKEVKKQQEHFDGMKDKLDITVGNLQSDKICLEEALNEKQELIKNGIPAYEASETIFEERTKEYEAKKKSVVSLKNQKSSLEDATARGKREIVKLSNPSVVLRQELKNQRTRALSKMKEQAKELKKIEECIFQAGKKLMTVTFENKKFIEGIQKLEGDCVSMKHQNELNTSLKNTLNSELNLQRDKLVAGWQEEKAMQMDSSDRDLILLEDITDLRERTDKREQKIAEITEKLHNELVLLAKFLNNVAQRRPQETSQGQKPAVTSRPPTVLKNYLESYKQLGVHAAVSTDMEEKSQSL